MLQWEPFPTPLVPKNPFKFIDIGPLFALREKIMIITPLTRAINRRNEEREVDEILGGEKREREKERI